MNINSRRNKTNEESCSVFQNKFLQEYILASLYAYYKQSIEPIPRMSIISRI